MVVGILMDEWMICGFGYFLNLLSVVRSCSFTVVEKYIIIISHANLA